MLVKGHSKKDFLMYIKKQQPTKQKNPLSYLEDPNAGEL